MRGVFQSGDSRSLGVEHETASDDGMSALENCSWDLGFTSGNQGSKHCLAMNCVFSCGSINCGDWFMGGRVLLWASREQTLLGNELSMQFWVNALLGLVSHDSGFASGCPGSKHCSAMN